MTTLRNHALTRRDLSCPACRTRCEYHCPLSQETPHLHCPECGALLRRYFGGQDTPINYGFRESRYYNPTDENIAKYQFTHL